MGKSIRQIWVNVLIPMPSILTPCRYFPGDFKPALDVLLASTLLAVIVNINIHVCTLLFYYVSLLLLMYLGILTNTYFLFSQDRINKIAKSCNKTCRSPDIIQRAQGLAIILLIKRSQMKIRVKSLLPLNFKNVQVGNDQEKAQK